MWSRPAWQTLSKALDISSATARVVLDLLKALAILSNTTVRRSAVHREDLKPYWKSEKSSHLIDHGTLESGISCKWCDKFSRLIEWFVYADGNGRNNFWFDCQSTLYIWHLIAEGPLQFHLATFFSKNSLWTETTKNDQKWPKNNVFSLFWKILQLIFAGNDLK